MGRKKSEDEESDELVAFVNRDLIEDFASSYIPSGKGSFDKCITRSMLRDMLGIYSDINSADALPYYIAALEAKGFKESMGFCGEPCIYVKEVTVPEADIIDDDFDEDEDYEND